MYDVTIFKLKSVECGCHNIGYHIINGFMEYLDRSMQKRILANKEKFSTLCEGNLVSAYFNFKRSI